MIHNLDNPLSEAVIYLKDGKRKYGMLMDTPGKDDFYFISNSDLNSFQKTKNEKYIETVPTKLIEAIDMDLK
jgi:hypothetical protein